MSAIFDRFVRAVVLYEQGHGAPGPLTAQALGLVQLPEDKTDSELLQEAMTEKQGD